MRPPDRWVIVLALAAGACGGGSSRPSGPSTTAIGTPGPPLSALAGAVVSQVTRAGLGGVRVEIVSGADAGKAATTDPGGRYRIEGLQSAGFTVRASVPDRESEEKTAVAERLDFALRLRPCAAASCGSVPADCNESIGLLRPPFDGSFRAANQFDHWRPQAGFQQPNDGRFVRWCGSGGSYDGHNGWDWLMPEGTPILAAAGGEVRRATSETPFFCPFLNREVSGLYVHLLHRTPEREAVLTEYLHLSRLLVSAGERVEAGQPVGLSGTTGCSTAPHLHFAVYRQFVNSGSSLVTVDPFGWQGAGRDPWADDPQGAASPWLWLGPPPPVAVTGPGVRELHHTVPPDLAATPSRTAP